MIEHGEREGYAVRACFRRVGRYNPAVLLTEGRRPGKKGRRMAVSAEPQQNQVKTGRVGG